MSSALNDVHGALAVECERSASFDLSTAEAGIAHSRRFVSSRQRRLKLKLTDIVQGDWGLSARLGSCKADGVDKYFALAHRDQELEALRSMVANLREAFAQEHAARQAASAGLEDARWAAAS
ncbi:uncharacterized protein LAESUDRAFT_808178 [Laetiporus sulphureus 93-53]|uniref:Uncharacterized protein n=1 Tax=Laetiporus sulphureus 93-53 TaxID=1314785 RepID=A0A165I4M4_9APHY|nr:uncharacterized protein LAESUDRAFT_808178 [Laetiporus sulphureus 93-53]KZT12588.1 hypothetical protein LAESUDRAFT_808178 [Laetiporus sulphureus 93-53]